MLDVKQLEKSKKPIMGCFPLYPPLELFHSMGLQPFILWGFKRLFNDTHRSDRHIQDFVCSIGRNLIEFILSNYGKVLDGVFFYNTCDCLRNIPEILQEALKLQNRDLSFFNIHIPMKSLEKEYYRNYLRNEISLLIRDLEGFTQDKFTFKNFKKSVNFYSKIRILSTQLEDIITRKNISYNTYVKLMNTQNYLDVKRRINLLETSLEEYRSKKEYPKQSIPNNILLTGIMPPPLKIIEIIEGLGLKIVGNDIAFLSREISNTPKSSSYESVEEYYIQFYKRHFPDPTLLYTSDMRCQKIKELVKQKGADGVIFIGEKFCEYEYFELPILKDALKDIGRPLLSLEFSIDDSFNIEQYRTRIQAFRELLNKE